MKESSTLKPEIKLGKLYHIERIKLNLSNTEMIVARFEVEVPREIKIYSKNGYNLQISYDIEKQRYIGQYLTENHTNAYNDFKFSDEVLENVIKPQIQAYINRIITEV